MTAADLAPTAATIADPSRTGNLARDVAAEASALGRCNADKLKVATKLKLLPPPPC